MLKEFKQFALKGNVLDLALAVVIGAAFSKIVTSLVKDIVMPLLGLLMGGVNFSSLVYKSINFGLFIQAIIDFLIIVFSLFIFIKVITSVKKKKIEEKAIDYVPSNEEVLLTEIRDLLQEKK